MRPQKNATPIAKAIRQVVTEFAEHPYDINDGRCDEFADRVCELVPDAKAVDLSWGRYGHVAHFALLWRRKWYDAEEPEGVKSWKHLPLVQRQQSA